MLSLLAGNTITSERRRKMDRKMLSRANIELMKERSKNKDSSKFHSYICVNCELDFVKRHSIKERKVYCPICYTRVLNE